MDIGNRRIDAAYCRAVVNAALFAELYGAGLQLGWPEVPLYRKKPPAEGAGLLRRKAAGASCGYLLYDRVSVLL